MRNRTHALRVLESNRALHLPIEWTDADELTCRLPSNESIVVAAGREDPVGELIATLKERRLDPLGCLNCRYFMLTGLDADWGGTSGHCIEGRLGKHVTEAERVSPIDSCDMHERDVAGEREISIRAWKTSLRA